jgi:hypothetical protein
LRSELRAPRFSIRGARYGPEHASTKKDRCGRKVPNATEPIEIEIALRPVRRPDSAAWLLLLVGSIAAWMSLGRLHYNHDADSIVTVLVSLQHWTPFYWGQDRFGMLVPLIATPIRHPLANMLVQGWVSTVAALLAPFLAARYLGAGPYWFATGALANAFFLLTFTDRLQFEWFVAQPYALSMSLAVAGLLVARERGVAATSPRWRSCCSHTG